MDRSSKGRFLFCNWRVLALVLIVMIATAPLQAGEDADLLDLDSGALVLSTRTQYRGRWNAQALVDGSNLYGWSSARGYPYPNEFLIELPRQCVLTSFVVDNTGAEESNFAGISARHFVLYGSTNSQGEVPALDAPVRSVSEVGLREHMEEIGQEKSLEQEGAPAILPEIYFATDSAEISQESEKRPEECWRAIQTYPYQKIVIKGPTDSTYTQEQNAKLSRRRAQSVAEWLIEQGLDAKQLETKAYGESRAVTDNKTEAGRALNRRVEILLQ